MKADVEINDLGSLGLIIDKPPYMLPPEAWSTMENVRCVDQAVHKLKGHSQVFGTPGVAPHFAMYVTDQTQNWWLYTSLTKAFVFDGTTHTDITRLAGDYTAANTRDWNGTILGGIPILNNGADVPQFWASYSAGTDLANLTNWPSTLRAKVVRAFGSYLVAINCTKSSVNFPHMVKWSHPATPGTVPSSWDETNQALDAGENDLPDTAAGLLVNALQLRGQLMLYKEGSVWRMRKVGGRLVFGFDSFIETNGLIAPRAVCLTPDGTRHVCLFQDDLVVHDSQRTAPLLTGKMRRALFRQIDVVNYRNCFLFANPEFNEVWVCYPEQGAVHPTRALIWKVDAGQVYEATISFRNAEVGAVETGGGTVWAAAVGTWATYAGPWGSSERRRVIVCGTDATKFFQLEDTDQRDGVSFPATLQRTGLSIIGQKRNGEVIVDFKKRKCFLRVWVKARGGPFNVRLGVQEYPEGMVTWQTPVSFDPTTQNWVDFTGSGRAVAVEFSSTGNVGWELQGYKVEVAPAGHF